jgi:signal transduction histidine kinase
MHDVLAHKVSLIALHAGGLEVNPAVGPDKVEGSARLIRETARQAMEDLREVLGVLRSDVSVDGAGLAPVPQASDLERLVEESRDAGVSVTGEFALPDDVPDSLGRTVYRVVQESLTNVLRHGGPAATARVRVEVDAATLRLEVIDTGRGAAPGASGQGINGMRARAEALGGSIEAGSPTNGGFAVRARLPVPDRVAAPAERP